MRILHCSDFHGDWLTGGVDRFADVRDAAAQTVKVAIERKVDAYLFTGDLTNPDDGPRALRAVELAISLAMLLDEENIESYWVAGNHDVIEDGTGRTTLSPLSALGCGVTVLEQPAVFPMGQNAMVFLPYPSATRPYDPGEWLARRRRELEGRRRVVVAAHLQVEGATPGDESREMARGRDVRFPFEECDPSWLLLGGHYHLAQTIERSGRRLHVVGSLARLNHGEEKHEPQFAVWEV